MEVSMLIYIQSHNLDLLYSPFPVISGRQKMLGPSSQVLQVVSRSSPGTEQLSTTLHMIVTLHLCLPRGIVSHTVLNGAGMVQTNTHYLHRPVLRDIFVGRGTAMLGLSLKLPAAAMLEYTCFVS